MPGIRAALLFVQAIDRERPGKTGIFEIASCILLLLRLLTND